VNDKQPSRPLEVLHVITGLARGGAEGMLVKLIGALHGRRSRHTVAVLTRVLDRAPELAALGVTVVPLGMTRPAGLPFAVQKLRRLLHELRPEVVQSWLWHADLVATLATQLVSPRPPLLWRLCGSDLDMRHYPGATAFTVATCARLSRLPDVILSNSRAGLDEHLRSGYRPRRSAVLSNGYDLDRFRPNASAGPVLRARFGWPADTELIGMVARAAPMKDHATLFGALELLLPRRPRLRCLLAGTGTDALAVPRSIAHAVQRLGAVPDPSHLLAGLDVNVLSSAFGEGSPHVLGEAMAVAVPSVATDVGDCRLALTWDGGSAGRIVPPRDPHALAHAIEALLDLPAAERLSLGLAGRARMEECFGIDTVALRHERMWRAAAERRLDSLPEFVSNGAPPPLPGVLSQSSGVP